MSTPPKDAKAQPARGEPQSFRARDLGVSLTVRDLAASVDWYERVIGFVVDRRHEREGKLIAVSLKAGEVAILLNQDDGARGWDRVKGEGLSMQFTTAQDIDALADRIRSRGGTLLTEPADMPWGPRVFRVADPDGFKLVFSS